MSRSPKVVAAVVSSRLIDGFGRSMLSCVRATSWSVIRTCLSAGTTNTTPGSRGWRSTTVVMRRRVRRCRISSRWLGRVGSMCCATTIGAANPSGMELSSVRSASMPPAEAPTTTSCSAFVGCALSAVSLESGGMLATLSCPASRIARAGSLLRPCTAQVITTNARASYVEAAWATGVVAGASSIACTSCVTRPITLVPRVPAPAITNRACESHNGTVLTRTAGCFSNPGAAQLVVMFSGSYLLQSLVGRSQRHDA